MGLPWDSHRITRDFHGTSIGLTVVFPGDSYGAAVLPWEYHGISIGIPWDFHGIITGKHFYGISMGFSLDFQRISVKTLQKYL